MSEDVRFDVLVAGDATQSPRRPRLLLNVLALSGSLREASSNTALLRVAARLAPPEVEVLLYGGLADLPHFNPDLDTALDDPRLPARARELRLQVARADALLICTPEYAHGVPGSLKDAFDWLVGGSEVAGMPAALVNASPRSTHAQESLAETLRTMAADLVTGSPFVVPLAGKRLDEDEMAAEPEVAGVLRSAFAALTPAALQGARPLLLRLARCAERPSALGPQRIDGDVERGRGVGHLKGGPLEAASTFPRQSQREGFGP